MREYPLAGRSRARGSGIRRGRGRATALVGAVALVAAGVATFAAANSEAAVNATVSVNVGSAKGTISAMGQGLNVAVWDGRMNDASQPALIKGAGVRALRYPGGSYGDMYHWKDGSAAGGYVAGNTGFDAFMATAKAAGVQPVLIANYGSGTAQEAADWVTYANKTKGYGVTYWEIGNEVYGNGYYGANWEKDDHAEKGPKAYATNALEYISKMKAADPSVKIGVVLTTPGNWPDGQKAGGDAADWNNTVLSIVGGKADFGIIHWYPTSKSATENLGKPSEIATMTGSLRSLYAKYNATNLGIAVTEMNAAYQDDSATAGLFAADSYLTWWENGVFNTDWWQLRNGNDGKVSTNEDGTTNYNEAGIVSVGGNGQPPVDTPFPTYYGLTLAGRLGAPGDTLVAATSTNPKLIAHAVKTASGGVNVLLINEDLNNPTTVSLTGINAGGTVTVEQWKKGDSGISNAPQASAAGITVPAYSITLLKTSGGATPAPTAPSPTTPAPTTPAPTTPAPTTPAPTTPSPTTPAPTTPAPTTPSPTTPAPTTPSPTTPAPTTPSPTTPAPTTPANGGGGQSATCTASYVQVAGWGGGFLGSVTVTNPGSAAISGWTVQLSLAPGQSVVNLWNGKASGKTGTISVANAFYNGTVAAGGSQVFGFVANGSSATVPRAVSCTVIGAVPGPGASR
ncbi:MAG TPA: cellulose binding domain-containing protein [Kineosporiaceae bacterium]|nr:cellulose binding domain-containing protein [Kineosporiaceae bacterium]